MIFLQGNLTHMFFSAYSKIVYFFTASEEEDFILDAAEEEAVE